MMKKHSTIKPMANAVSMITAFHIGPSQSNCSSQRLNFSMVAECLEAVSDKEADESHGGHDSKDVDCQECRRFDEGVNDLFQFDKFYGG